MALGGFCANNVPLCGWRRCFRGDVHLCIVSFILKKKVSINNNHNNDRGTGALACKEIISKQRIQNEFKHLNSGSFGCTEIIVVIDARIREYNE